MRSVALARRNFIEVWRDPLSISLTIALPIGMLLVLMLLEGVDPFFTATSLTPGVVLFGFVMLMFSAALALSRDRESALFSRLLTAPLRSNDFVTGYSIPYLPVAIIQTMALFAVGLFLGLEMNGNMGLLIFILLAMAVFYIAAGMILGVTFSSKTVTFPYMVILLLTIFGGAWMDVNAIGGPIQAVGNVFPFAHAIDAARGIMIDGADLATVASDLWWILGYTVVAAVIAVVVFRRKMVE